MRASLEVLPRPAEVLLDTDARREDEALMGVISNDECVRSPQIPADGGSCDGTRAFQDCGANCTYDMYSMYVCVYIYI